MLRLLVLLGISFYAVLAVFGEDQGQLRMGLRDAETAPGVQSPPPAPVVLVAAPAETAPSETTPSDTAPADASTAVPHQALRVLAPPSETTLAVLTEDAAAEAVLQTASIPAETVEEEPALAPNVSLRWVAVDSANVRARPGRNGAIAGRVERDEAVEVLWVEPSGWVRIRVQGDGVDGFVFGNLLTDVDPTAN